MALDEESPMEADQQRDEVHSMMDRLPGDKLPAFHHLLGTLVGLSEPIANAPSEDEELADETLASIERGRRCFERGEFTSHEEMLQEFGG